MLPAPAWAAAPMASAPHRGHPYRDLPSAHRPQAIRHLPSPVAPAAEWEPGQVGPPSRPETQERQAEQPQEWGLTPQEAE